VASVKFSHKTMYDSIHLMSDSIQTCRNSLSGSMKTDTNQAKLESNQNSTDEVWYDSKMCESIQHFKK
jgi:hypothetical protein